ncbi:hypothetical protein Tco_1139542 [Tanacetum coccineum]
MHASGLDVMVSDPLNSDAAAMAVQEFSAKATVKDVLDRSAENGGCSGTNSKDTQQVINRKREEIQRGFLPQAQGKLAVTGLVGGDDLRTI